MDRAGLTTRLTFRRLSGVPRNTDDRKPKPLECPLHRLATGELVLRRAKLRVIEPLSRREDRLRRIATPVDDQEVLKGVREAVLTVELLGPERVVLGHSPLHRLRRSNARKRHAPVLSRPSTSRKAGEAAIASCDPLMRFLAANAGSGHAGTAGRASL